MESLNVSFMISGPRPIASLLVPDNKNYLRLIKGFNLDSLFAKYPLMKALLCAWAGVGKQDAPGNSWQQCKFSSL